MATNPKTTLLLTLAVAMLAAPATAQAEPTIREQPQDVKRPEVVQVAWEGGSLPVDPQVFVERRHGLRWVTEGRANTGDVLLDHADEGVWSARWQPTYDSPSGLYRVRVEGADYALTSDEFRVRPCQCVIPNQVRVGWRDGRFRLRMTAIYAPGPPTGFRSLATWVTTGRPLVRVYRDGRRIGSVRLRYDQPVSGERGAFRGTWAGPRGQRNSIVFRLVSLTDGFGNR